ncbi:9f79e63f-658f-4075-b70e-346be41cd3b5 [Sclerotinia trifoliorum]|uniref:9f79e63f-658f-4075-b70e-346be41cd3b5 n=1 Tax=Sclerotinia trifoliorum TaxID=28548 RepID=A0A8H2W0U6_9HELO|nr:9f79e63f-658f-4075-b70e-346be41cd3b5 [Sclerotinia trifoliorum]
MDQRFAQMDQRFVQMDQRFVQINQRFDTLEARMIALNLNSVARVQNSMVSYLDRGLFPLVNVSTSENIPEFPKTLVAFNCISNANINRVLLALGVGTDGTLEAKRDRLRDTIGIKVDGV